MTTQQETNNISPPPQNYIYSPNATNIVNMLDTVTQFIETGKTLKDKLKGNFSTEAINGLLQTAIRERNPQLAESIQKFMKLKDKFDEMEVIFLVETSRTLGFEGRDYLIKPLKELIDKIKTLDVTPTYAIEQIKKLIRTLSLSKVLNNVEAIPTVGPAINSFMINLDNFGEAQQVMAKIVRILELFGVTNEQIKFIKRFTNDTVITMKYKEFQKWLADGAPLDIEGTFKSMKEKTFGAVNGFFVKLKNTVIYFFIPPPKNYNPDKPQDTTAGKDDDTKETSSASQTAPTTPTTPPESEPAPAPVSENNQQSAKQMGGAIPEFHKKNTHRKTRREIHKINKSIQKYLSRLRRTRRKPFHKSVASRKIKRRF
jgi:hypothetical protein